MNFAKSHSFLPSNIKKINKKHFSPLKNFEKKFFTNTSKIF